MESMNNCNDCEYGVDYGDSVEYIYCEKGKRKKTVKKINTCKDYKKSKMNTSSKIRSRGCN